MTPKPTAEPEQTPDPTPDDEGCDATANLPALAIRGGFGGALMGLANLVPGISGGTMLLAAGVYTRFIEAISEVTTLKFHKASLVTLGSVLLSAAVAILLLAGTVKMLVIDYRWVMYSIFIGLTLGGVPVVWRLIKQADTPDEPEQDEARDNGSTRPVWIGAAVGFVCMAALAVIQSSGVTGDAKNDSFFFLLLAGLAGASAMILPGVSGGYLLLVLGVYVPVLTGIDALWEGVQARDFEVILDVGLRVVLPVGLGVLVGVVGVSNLLRWLLRHYEKATLGVLLGLLVGAVVGLWPFQKSVDPVEGQLIKGREVAYGNFISGETVTEEPAWYYVESSTHVDPDDFPTGFFTPTGGQIAGSLGLIVLGLGTTLLIDRVQGSGSKD